MRQVSAMPSSNPLSASAQRSMPVSPLLRLLHVSDLDVPNHQMLIAVGLPGGPHDLAPVVETERDGLNKWGTRRRHVSQVEHADIGDPDGLRWTCVNEEHPSIVDGKGAG